MHDEPRNNSPLHAGLPGGLNNVGLDQQVLQNKVGRIGGVGHDPADLGRGDDHVTGPLLLEKTPHVGLLGELQLRVAPGDQLIAVFGGQPAVNGRAHQTPVPGHIYLRTLW